MGHTSSVCKGRLQACFWVLWFYLSAHTQLAAWQPSEALCEYWRGRRIMTPCSYAFFFFWRRRRRRRKESAARLPQTGFINSKGDSLSLLSEFHTCRVRNGGHEHFIDEETESHHSFVISGRSGIKYPFSWLLSPWISGIKKRLCICGILKLFFAD